MRRGRTRGPSSCRWWQDVAHEANVKEGVKGELLLARHGPMVFNVCRRVSPEQHLVEDAFQATFLVLVRFANSIGKRELLSNWLYGCSRTAVTSFHRHSSSPPRTRPTSV